jgi:hypothetical protein
LTLVGVYLCKDTEFRHMPVMSFLAAKAKRTKSETHISNLYHVSYECRFCQQTVLNSNFGSAFYQFLMGKDMTSP